MYLTHNEGKSVIAERFVTVFFISSTYKQCQVEIVNKSSKC